MNVEVAVTKKGMPLPKYQTNGAVAFDFLVAEKTTIQPRDVSYIPTGVIVKIPEGLFLAVIARSSILRKKKLVIPFGAIDNDYCGPEDEIFIQAYNIGKEAVTLEKGDRIAQGIFISMVKANLIKTTKKFKNKSRGSGSTG